ncbi:MAG: leucine-rich repeat domain-containing protein, partial [Erysipelotrichales bacterium]|nr:leucine-rich repeat domain-containing protein [Erysipelotrichales bacterium]
FESGSKLETIGSSAFSSCSSLTSIVIPSSVTSIGNYAFSGCTKLKTVTFESGSKLEAIGIYVFNDCGSLQYNEYGNCYYLGNNENPYLALVKAKDKDITEVTISNNTKFIMSNAFEIYKSLTSIIIPSSVTSIGSLAFCDCTNLQTVTFESGSKLETIGSYAFSGCNSLTSIVIPSSVTSIENSAFYGCYSLTFYCEVSSQPSEWSSNWNYYRPVYWSGEWSYVNGVPTPNK